MLLKILGSGTSTGVPIPGCRCAVCISDKPRNKRSRTSALIVTDSGAQILIDTSPDLRTQALTWDVRRLDAVLYTHEHADHTAGIDDLRGFCYTQHMPIPCYGSQVTLGHLRQRFSYIFNPDPNYMGAMLPQILLNEITELQAFELCAVRFMPFPLIHGRAPVTGYRFGDLGYATDCSEIPEASKEVLKGVKTLIIAGLRFEPHRTHFTISQAIAEAQALGVQRTILIHSNHNVDYYELSAKLPANVELAYDGMEIEVMTA